MEERLTCRLWHRGLCFLTLLYEENGRSRLLRGTTSHLPDSTVSQPTRRKYETTLMVFILCSIIINLQQSTNKMHAISHLHIHNYIDTMKLLHVSDPTESHLHEARHIHSLYKTLIIIFLSGWSCLVFCVTCTIQKYIEVFIEVHWSVPCKKVKKV